MSKNITLQNQDSDHMKFCKSITAFFLLITSLSFAQENATLLFIPNADSKIKLDGIDKDQCQTVNQYLSFLAHPQTVDPGIQKRLRLANNQQNEGCAN